MPSYSPTVAATLAFTRDLSGMFETTINPDALVLRFLSNAYYEMCSLADFPQLRSTFTLDIAANQTGPFSPPRPVRGWQVRSVHATRTGAGSGSTRALEPVLAGDRVPGGPGPVTGYWDQRPVYDTSVVAGLSVLPMPYPVRLTVEYTMTPADPFGPDTDPGLTWLFPVPADLTDAVAYRAAAQLLAKEGENADRQKWLLDEYSALCQRMVDRLTVSNDPGPVAFGAEATRRDGYSDNAWAGLA